MRNMRVNRGLVTGSVVAGVALTIGLGGVGYAATGGSFVLGHANQANQVSVLKGTAGTPLALHAPAGSAPLRVNSGVKVANLNADKIDGLDSSALQKAGTAVRVSDRCSPPARARSTGRPGPSARPVSTRSGAAGTSRR